MLGIWKHWHKNMKKTSREQRRADRTEYAYSTSIIVQIETFCVGMFGNRGGG